MVLVWIEFVNRFHSSEALGVRTESAKDDKGKGVADDPFANGT